jgi:hypothetical protein
VEYSIQVEGMTMESMTTWEYVVNLLKGFLEHMLGSFMLALIFTLFVTTMKILLEQKNVMLNGVPKKEKTLINI